jgi:hypothetical protein
MELAEQLDPEAWSQIMQRDLYRAIGATGHAERLARELDA